MPSFGCPTCLGRPYDPQAGRLCSMHEAASLRRALTIATEALEQVKTECTRAYHSPIYTMAANALAAIKKEVPDA